MLGSFASLMKGPRPHEDDFSHRAIRVAREFPSEDSLKNSLQKASGGQEPLDVFFVKKIAAFLGAVFQRQNLPAGRRDHGD